MMYNLVTGLLLGLAFNGGLALVGDHPRRVPWFAVALTAVAVGGVSLQLLWPGAMDALDHDPSKTGWYRVVTSTFMQNGGTAGIIWNLVTIAAIGALAEYYWGGLTMLLLFVGGILLPGFVTPLLGVHVLATESRNYAGSSGATYFLAATLAAALLLQGREVKHRLLALSVPAVALTTWFIQDNAHGLVAAEGFVFGLLVWLMTAALRTAAGCWTCRGRSRPVAGV